MKTSIILSMGVIFCLGVFSSCEKETVEPPTISINNSYLEIPYQGGSYSTNLTSNSNWHLTYEKCYMNGKERPTLYPIKINPSSGTGNSSITISAETNKFKYDIKQTITFTAQSTDYSLTATSQITVILKANPNGIDENGNSDTPDDNDDEQIQAPSNVKAVKEGKTIVVTWDAVEGANSYEVFHASSANGNYSSYGHWTQNKYIDEVVLTEHNYYKIKAKGKTTSDFSNYAYCNFTSDEPETNTPPTPTGLYAVQEGQTIVISWNSVNNIYYYRLHYRTPLGAESFINVYAPSTTTVFDQNMHDGTYTFWIQAVASDYTASDPSSKITCSFKSNNGGGGDEQKKLDTPKNLEAFSSDRFVQISFDEVSLAYQYELYRSKYATSGYKKITAVGGSSGNKYILTDQNPQSGTSYYKVKAIALSYLDIEDSDFSDYVKVTR